jgi:hypothetical protein
MRFAGEHSEESASMADNRANESQNEKWLDSLKDLVAVVLKSKEGDNSFLVATRLLEKLRESGLPLPAVLITPYVNPPFAFTVSRIRRSLGRDDRGDLRRVTKIGTLFAQQ